MRKTPILALLALAAAGSANAQLAGTVSGQAGASVNPGPVAGAVGSVTGAVADTATAAAQTTATAATDVAASVPAPQASVAADAKVDAHAGHTTRAKRKGAYIGVSGGFSATRN